MPNERATCPIFEIFGLTWLGFDEVDENQTKASEKGVYYRHGNNMMRRNSNNQLIRAKPIGHGSETL